jgi:hypothetical protein
LPNRPNVVGTVELQIEASGILATSSHYSTPSISFVYGGSKFVVTDELPNVKFLNCGKTLMAHEFFTYVPRTSRIRLFIFEYENDILPEMADETLLKQISKTSHDLRNALAIPMSYAQLLEMSLAGENKKTAGELNAALEELRTALDREMAELKKTAENNGRV